MERLSWGFNPIMLRYEIFLDGKVYFATESISEFLDGIKMLRSSL